MRSDILYVELKSGFEDNGPAWIGKGSFSKTGQTIYFNGKILKRGNSSSGNYFDLESGDYYWISGVKKDGTNRHWAGSGVIEIDESIIPEYLQRIERSNLDKKRFRIVTLENSPAKDRATEIENQKWEQGFDDSIRFKNINDLTDKELEDLLNYYKDMDMTLIHKKARKEYIEKMNQLETELAQRIMVKGN